MRASEVLTDHHVLDGLPRSSHVHAVWQVFPSGTVVFGLLLQNLVGLVSNNSRNIIGLGRSARGVDKDHSVLADEGIIERTREKLVVSPVHGVTALEGDDIDVIGKGLTDLRGGLAREITHGKVQSGNFSSHVVLSTLGGNHERAGVLDLGRSVALQALVRLVGEELVGEFDRGDVAVSVLEEDLVSRLKILVVGIEDDGEAEDEAGVGEFDIVNDVLVGLLVHETVKGGEGSVHEELDIAELTGAQLECLCGGGNGGGLFLIGFEDEVDKSSSVGSLLGGLQLGSTRTHGHRREDITGGNTAGDSPGRSVDGSEGRRRGGN
mmetsp:Transcript_30548/g.56042  ORF Transcript_30548/g.56042 Transcript_30548/m.56042 type:complete len:322 (+) Transcript_30548:398-1363(+)